MTSLLFAAREGHREIARTLIEAGADLERRSANGTTALVVAIINNHIRLAMFLLEKGANPNSADDFYKRTPLFAAVETRNLDFARDSPPLPPDREGGDPLDLIRLLLMQGADPNSRTNTTPVRGFMQASGNWVSFDGQTPFIRAALAGDVTVMRLLLDYGADANIATSLGTTALMAAAGINWVVSQTFSRTDDEYLEAARLCIEKGADVNAANSQGFTAMHGAANKGFDAMVRLLAAHGARLDVQDAHGRTPMTFAEGVFLALQPPSRKPSTIALLKELQGL
jgi:ankyrin repeat protein